MEIITFEDKINQRCAYLRQVLIQRAANISKPLAEKAPPVGELTMRLDDIITRITTGKATHESVDELLDIIASLILVSISIENKGGEK